MHFAFSVLTIFGLLTISFLAKGNQSYQLTIRNNTPDTFKVYSAPARQSLGILRAFCQNLFNVPMMIPNKFAVLLESNIGEKQSIFYLSGQLFCNPQTTTYHCSFEQVGVDHATVTLTREMG